MPNSPRPHDSVPSSGELALLRGQATVFFSPPTPLGMTEGSRKPQNKHGLCNPVTSFCQKVSGYILAPLIGTLLLLCTATVSAKTPIYEIRGVAGPIAKNIQARLDGLLKENGETLYQNNYAQFQAIAVENITKAIQPFGYYHAKIQQQGRRPPFAFIIKLGPVMHITRTDIVLSGSGKNETFFRQIQEKFPLKKGDILLTEQYTKAKGDFFDTASHHGYMKARFTKSEIQIDRDKNQAAIILYFDTGARYYFGKISFSPSPYSEDFLRRYLRFKPGDPYSPDEILNLQQALSGAGYFKHVGVEYRLDQNKSRYIPIHVVLEPMPARTYSLGAGFGTDTGVRARAGINLLRINPQGDKFQAYVQGSQIQNNLQAAYTIPGQDPLSEHYSLSASFSTLDYPVGKSDSFPVSVTYFKDKGHRQMSFGLTALRENYQYYNLASGLPLKATLFYPKGYWQWRKVDSPIFPTHGYNFSVYVLGASESLLSSTSVVQVAADFKTVYTLPSKTRLFIHLNQGFTAIDDLTTLPLSLQFLTGGTQSLSAYSYQSIGPGKFLSVASLEVQHPIIEKWYITAFYQVGNVYNSTPLDLLHSMGAGVMWVTPIGPVRAAIATSGSLHLSALRFVFSMGPEL